MHISEGILSPGILAGGAAMAVAGTAMGLKRLDYDRIMQTGIFSAVFFVGSLIHVPIGPTNAHLLLNGLLGMLLGWAAFPAILVALLLQAMLFQYGGLTTLGVNACTMGYSAVICWYCFRMAMHFHSGPNSLRVASFLAGFLGVGIAAFLTASVLAFSHEGFWLAARLLFVAHLPVMLVEGLITMFTADVISRVQPDMFILFHKDMNTENS